MGTNAHPISGVDSLAPAEIAQLVEERGVAKANASFLTTFVLGVLAGAFIALGALLSTVVATGSTFGYGGTKLLSGVAFSLGLILVVVAGAELFTGNNLIMMSWVSRHMSRSGDSSGTGRSSTSGTWSERGSIVAMLYLADWWKQGGRIRRRHGAVDRRSPRRRSRSRRSCFRGILANALVCLAVWLRLAPAGASPTRSWRSCSRSRAFVAAGFEHSIANMYFLPMGLALKGEASVVQASGLSVGEVGNLDVGATLVNVVAATLGNVIGGAGLVGLVYWFVYLRTSSLASK